MSIFERIFPQPEVVVKQSPFDAKLLDTPNVGNFLPLFQFENGSVVANSEATERPLQHALTGIIAEYCENLTIREAESLIRFLFEFFEFNQKYQHVVNFDWLDQISDQSKLKQFFASLKATLECHSPFYKMQIAHCVNIEQYLQGPGCVKENLWRSRNLYGICPDGEKFLLNALASPVPDLLDGHLLVKGLRRTYCYSEQGLTAGLCIRTTNYKNGAQFQAGVWYRPREIIKSFPLLQQKKVSKIDWIAVRPLYPFWLANPRDRKELMQKLIAIASR